MKQLDWVLLRVCISISVSLEEMQESNSYTDAVCQFLPLPPLCLNLTTRVCVCVCVFVTDVLGRCPANSMKQRLRFTHHYTLVLSIRLCMQEILHEYLLNEWMNE